MKLNKLHLAPVLVHYLACSKWAGALCVTVHSIRLLSQIAIYKFIVHGITSASIGNVLNNLIPHTWYDLIILFLRVDWLNVLVFPSDNHSRWRTWMRYNVAMQVSCVQPMDTFMCRNWTPGSPIDSLKYFWDMSQRKNKNKRYSTKPPFTGHPTTRTRGMNIFFLHDLLVCAIKCSWKFQAPKLENQKRGSFATFLGGWNYSPVKKDNWCWKWMKMERMMEYCWWKKSCTT